MRLLHSSQGSGESAKGVNVNRALCVAIVGVGLLVVAGLGACGPAATSSSKSAPSYADARTIVTSERIVSAPTNPGVVASLLAQKRVALSTDRTTTSIEVAFPQPPFVRTMSEALAKRDVPTWIPDESLAGSATAIAAERGVGGGYFIQARYRAFRFSVSFGHPSPDPRGDLRRFAGFHADMTPMTQGAPRRGFLVSVRGNLGTGWSRVVQGKGDFAAAMPARVNWTEDASHYELSSTTLDPDQLLAIAGSMPLIKP